MKQQANFRGRYFYMPDAAPGNTTPDQWKAILDAHDGRCYLCGAPADTIEHARAVESYRRLGIGDPFRRT